MNRLTLGWVVLTGWLLMACSSPGAGTWYVATNGASPWNGSSWATAFTNLQQALDAAAGGDAIYVAGHTFFTTTEISWTQTGISILGQCATSAEPPTDLSLTPTIFQRSTNTVRVMAIRNVTNGILNRVTITGGNTGSGTPGAGVYSSNCTNLLIVSCVISNNFSADNGAGLYSLNSSVTLTNCVVSNNRVNNQGGGQYYGGGLAAAAGSGSLNLWNCVVANNRVTVQPGASKLGLGGGVYSGIPVLLHNCLIYGNEANSSGNGVGDGVYLVSGSLSMGNCTVAYNAGQGVCRGGGTVAISNSIAWGNVDDITGSVSLAYCDISDGDSNGVAGCISMDPQFQNGFYLAPGSPCVDTGNVDVITAGITNLTTRTDGVTDSGTVDLGYHYSTGFDLTYTNIYVDAARPDDSGLGTNWTQAFKSITKALSVAKNGTTVYVASGQYTNGVETFPLSLIDKTSIRIAGTNSSTTLIINTGTTQRVLALVNLAGNTRVEGITITGGKTGQGTPGAGVYAEYCANLVVASCSMTNNNGGDNGGGFYAFGSIVTLTNCVLTDNRVNNQGGGTYYGGAVAMTGGSGSMNVWNCIMANNRVTVQPGASKIGYGGGLYSAIPSILRNCLFYGNEANTSGNGAGDGVYLAAGTLSMGNCTVAYNAGQGICCAGGTLSVSNSIAWGNADDITGSIALAYCDISDGDSNNVAGCISQDPLFENGYYLATNSPCVNTGGMTAVAAGLNSFTTRSDGIADNGTVDLGWHYEQGIAASGYYSDLYVSEPNGLDSRTGTNWSTSLRSLTKALSMASDGTYIHVASGRYTNGVETFPLFLNGKQGVQIVATNPSTTLIINTGSTQRVLTLLNLAGNTRIEGLTITGGKAGTGAPGGGIYAEFCANLVISSCILSNNTTANNGGGLSSMGSIVTLTNCIVSGNSANNSDGGFYCGGGLATSLGSGSMNLRNCIITSNRITVQAGVGKYGRGGGLYSIIPVVLRNCLIYGNEANTAGNGYGDALYCDGGTMTAENCTITTNMGQGVCLNAGTLSLVNSIILNNGYDVSGNVSMAYCDFGVASISVTTDACISADPIFRSPLNNDYQLRVGSPCINTATNLTWMIGAQDLAGTRRRIGRTPDMGAYESLAAAGAIFVMH